MKPQFPIRAKNETGNVTTDIEGLIVPDSAIEPGSKVLNLALSTGDMTGPSSAVSGNAAEFNGTSGKVVADSGYGFPSDATGTLGYLNVPQSSFSAARPIVLTDAGKMLYHPASDANARQVTIPANGSVAFPIGSAITVVNMSANDVTVVITTDVLKYVDVGTITTLTIPTNNMATLLKTGTQEWLASGSAGCTTA